MAPAYSEKKLRLASRLKDARGTARMTQEQAAHAVGTSRRHWIRWENGETMPNSQYLDRIGEVLGEDLSEFADDDEEESSAMPLPNRDVMEALHYSLGVALGKSSVPAVRS